jgi:ATP-dependent DNA helicase RecQ
MVWEVTFSRRARRVVDSHISYRQDLIALTNKNRSISCCACCQLVLQSKFGYGDFRPGQREVMVHVAGGQNAILLMSTSGGKSLCFQIPGLVRGGLTVVLTLLVCLMLDQVKTLRAKGLAAASISSQQSQEENASVVRAIYDGKLDFLYVSPGGLVLMLRHTMLE